MTGKIIGLYQHIPENINPAAFSIHSFSVRWYAISYLAGFLAIYSLLKWRVRKGEGISKLKLKDYEWRDIILDLLFYSFIGLLLGARLGYAVFYDFKYFLNNPFAIVSPFDEAGNLVGIYGMSYFGGLIGVVFSGWLYSRKKKINFWQLADFVIPAVPAGYFFGRIGNFLNGELYGRATDAAWGMYFNVGNADLRSLQLRHPSQLYEAFFEGLVLFHENTSYPSMILLSSAILLNGTPFSFSIFLSFSKHSGLNSGSIMFPPHSITIFAIASLLVFRLYLAFTMFNI